MNKEVYIKCSKRFLCSLFSAHIVLDEDEIIKLVDAYIEEFNDTESLNDVESYLIDIIFFIDEVVEFIKRDDLIDNIEEIDEYYTNQEIDEYINDGNDNLYYHSILLNNNNFIVLKYT